ncbi:CAAX geranylgeranyltransferase alpha subunit [Lodderomyces elongisporus]|uniref:Protein farnesyltransferase/geranylgeranyltransferase type-1 subunit alpha n=1 Tax=Lodderomyces elongisporus (strain ATCC 11503 / CBS 2605 / JCM 1781 / NBRC 1676 / NRRL YB-4239) TaxID=379508 RepID=A5DSU1_LODEL|nr:CAAX geranylgeranyltransferase alpha subunit [Lodderomyces elongisporus]EDK42249.1 hypothetical protein LELG_00427 [Lodderomyces elongisporus NRRL YB-4239]WLF76714.1 CAAX geranylgeranyltransferase alpha subunit [Lodderomyces elongisporus]
MTEFDYSDIEPVSLNTETPQLCQILYDQEYKEVMGTLLALMKLNEYSPRAKYITELGIEKLASHYTTWIYRYNILKNLPNTNYYDELDWCEQIALDNEKNFQIWNYRQLIINEIIAMEENSAENADEKEVKRKVQFDPHREFPIMAAMLDSDSKNHHVWSYRKWLVEKFNLFNDVKEHEFVNSCIELDLLNNSAWSHRFFLNFSDYRTDDSNEMHGEDLVEKEIEYVKNKITECPQNASSWDYLNGIYDKFDRDICELEVFANGFADFEQDNVKSTFAIELLAKIFMKKNQFDKCITQYEMLRDEYDPMRKNFWNYEISRIKELV